MEKTGRIVLTRDELDSFLVSSEVPERIKTDWEVSATELRSLIDKKDIVVLPKGGPESCPHCN